MSASCPYLDAAWHLRDYLLISGDFCKLCFSTRSSERPLYLKHQALVCPVDQVKYGALCQSLSDLEVSSSFCQLSSNWTLLGHGSAGTLLPQPACGRAFHLQSCAHQVQWQAIPFLLCNPRSILAFNPAGDPFLHVQLSCLPGISSKHPKRSSMG